MTATAPFPLTWLYVPGDRPHVVTKALASGADVVVIDLEDAVAPDRKEYARAATAELLTEPPPVPVHVRVNALDGPLVAADLAAVVPRVGLAGLRLPKVTSAGQVIRIAERTEPGGPRARLAGCAAHGGRGAHRECGGGGHGGEEAVEAAGTRGRGGAGASRCAVRGQGTCREPAAAACGCAADGERGAASGPGHALPEEATGPGYALPGDAAHGAGPPLYALLENALAVEQAYAIASAHPSLRGVSIGEADLRADLGVRQDAGLDWCRARVVVAARAAGLAPPAQSVHPDIRDLEGLAASCAHGRALGFLGRAAIHPRQLPIIERAYLPTDRELEEAETVVKAATVDRGAHALPDGRFIDAAVVAAARRTLALARRY
nr:hypothetical protein StreXyl84_47940 [Streptomyces sp. Xyl84]